MFFIKYNAQSFHEKCFMKIKTVFGKKKKKKFSLKNGAALYNWIRVVKSLHQGCGPYQECIVHFMNPKKHISVIHQCATRENDRSRGAIDFADRCLNSFSVYLVKSNFSLRISEKLSSVSLHKKGKTTNPPQRFLRDLQAWEITLRRCFLYWEQFFLNTLGKVLGNYSLWRMQVCRFNFTEIAFLTGYVSQNTPQEFKNNFLQEHLRNGASAAIHKTKNEDFGIFKVYEISLTKSYHIIF